MALPQHTMVHSYLERHRPSTKLTIIGRLLQEFISSLTRDQLARIGEAWLLRSQGYVALAKRWLDDRPGPDLELGLDCPIWCVCGLCRAEERVIERVCCGKRNCRSLEENFFKLVLDRDTVLVALKNKADVVADPFSHTNSAFRKTSYRQYILWQYYYCKGRNFRGRKISYFLYTKATQLNSLKFSTVFREGARKSDPLIFHFFFFGKWFVISWQTVGTLFCFLLYGKD